MVRERRLRRLSLFRSSFARHPRVLRQAQDERAGIQRLGFKGGAASLRRTGSPLLVIRAKARLFSRERLIIQRLCVGTKSGFVATRRDLLCSSFPRRRGFSADERLIIQRLCSGAEVPRRLQLPRFAEPSPQPLSRRERGSTARHPSTLVIPAHAGIQPLPFALGRHPTQAGSVDVSSHAFRQSSGQGENSNA